MIVKTQLSIYLLNAGVQDNNNYMFRPFLVAIIRLHIHISNSMYNKQTKLCLYSNDRASLISK